MKGQTLIEVLVALGLAGVVITAATIVVTASLNNAQFSRDQQLATNYAQEGMEIVRQIRGYDITGFRGYSGTYCLAKGQLTLSSPQSSCPTNVDIFTRSVVIEQSQCATNVARVSVNVSWTDGRCSSGGLCHKVPLVSCLSTVNPVTGP